MAAGHRHGGDKHGDTAQQKDCRANRKEATQHNKSVSVEQQNQDKDGKQHHNYRLSKTERPRNALHVIQEYVGQRRVLFRYTVVYDYLVELVLATVGQLCALQS